MMYELDQLDVATATFESRGPKDDERDRHILDALRTSKAVSSDLRIAHVPGPSEALLWVADAICGAVVRHRLRDSSYLEIIQASAEIKVIAIPPR